MLAALYFFSMVACTTPTRPSVEIKRTIGAARRSWRSTSTSKSSAVTIAAVTPIAIDTPIERWWSRWAVAKARYDASMPRAPWPKLTMPDPR